jgi:hypothetical protein
MFKAVTTLSCAGNEYGVFKVNKMTSLPQVCGAGFVAIAIGVLPLGAALADDTTPAAPAAPATPAKWSDTITVGGQLDIGITGNPSSPNDNRNYGRLYDDLSNEPTLNSLLLTMQRPLDPKATSYDVGFKLQGMYGSDARYTHTLGLFDRGTDRELQFDLVEAKVLLHTPWLSDGGIDFTAGQYVTPLGNEVIDPSGNTFYSHSYIYNFGLPVKHFGAYGTWHATPMVDVWGGVDAGNQTTAFDDNNEAAAGLAGIGLNGLAGGNLTILALSHFGPENPSGTVANANSAFRYYNDVVTTYKVSDKFTLVNELNWIRDDGLHADGYGVAQYATYALTDTLSLSGRAEIWRDAEGAFVSQFGSFLDADRELGGQAPLSSVTHGTGKPTTYGEVTLGVEWKPPVPSFISGTTVRPEIRYDSTLNGVDAYNDFKDKGMFTAAIDAVVPF